jgi:hypothetical protein
MHRITLRPSPALLVACLALVLALGGVAWARSGSGNDGRPTGGVIRACIQPDLGNGEGRELSLADEAGECPEGTEPIAWNVEGKRGAKGKPGPKGHRGTRGRNGARGAKGPAGATGPQGPAGPTGAKGDTGARGEAGPQGAAGPQGEVGPQGVTGERGPEGKTGPEGQRGLVGPPGPEGLPGISGYQVVTDSDQETVAGGGQTTLLAQAACPSGKKLIGGGLSMGGGTGEIGEDGPTLELDGTPRDEWKGYVLFKNPTGGNLTFSLTAVAYCAEVAS